MIRTNLDDKNEAVLRSVQGYLREVTQDIEAPSILLKLMADVVAAQTRVRLIEEKAEPDGTAWRPWSGGYARTRKSADSLLVDNSTHEGGLHLWQSLRREVDGTGYGFRVWSEKEYAGVHQFGSNTVRARRYFGVSAANEAQLDHVVHGWLAEVMA